MKNKTFMLITGLIGVGCTLADVLLAYFNPPMTAQIVGAIDIAQTASIEILSLFITKEIMKKS